MQKIKTMILIIGLFSGGLYGYLNYHSYVGLVMSGTALLFWLSLIIVRIGKKKKLSTKDILKIDNLSGEDFEKLLYHRLKQEGYSVELTSLSHDYGADLVITKNHKCHERIVIQAKRYKDSVGIKAVQEIAGAIPYYHAAKGMVITNNYYTKSAKELAAANQITLINRQGLLEWLNGQQFDKLGTRMINHNNKQPKVCPRCGSGLVLRNSTYGSFYGCSKYPKCKYTKPEGESAFRIS